MYESAAPDSPLVELLMNIVAGGFVVAALVLAVWVVKKLRDGRAALEEEGREAEGQFARQQEELLAGKAPRSTSLPALASPVQPPAPFPFAPPATPTADPGARLLDTASRLVGLGVLAHSEGRVALGIPPDGLVYRLKRGGLCAIIPRLESEAVMLHLARRYDLLVILTADGELLTLDRFQTRLKDITAPMI